MSTDIAATLMDQARGNLGPNSNPLAWRWRARWRSRENAVILMMGWNETHHDARLDHGGETNEKTERAKE